MVRDVQKLPVAPAPVKRGAATSPSYQLPFSHYGKIADQSSLGRRGGNAVPCDRGGMGAGVEGAGGVVSTDRRQRAMNTQLTFLFLFSPGPQPVRWSCPCSGLSLSISVNLIQIILHRCAQRLISSVVLDPAKLAVSPSHLSSGPVTDGLHCDGWASPF